MSKKIGKKIWIYVGVGVFLVIVGIISWGVATDWKFIGDSKKSGGGGPPPPPPPPPPSPPSDKCDGKCKKDETCRQSINDGTTYKCCPNTIPDSVFDGEKCCSRDKIVNGKCCENPSLLKNNTNLPAKFNSLNSESSSFSIADVLGDRKMCCDGSYPNKDSKGCYQLCGGQHCYYPNICEPTEDGKGFSCVANQNCKWKDLPMENPSKITGDTCNPTTKCKKPGLCNTTIGSGTCEIPTVGININGEFQNQRYKFLTNPIDDSLPNRGIVRYEKQIDVQTSDTKNCGKTGNQSCSCDKKDCTATLDLYNVSSITMSGNKCTGEMKVGNSAKQPQCPLTDSFRCCPVSDTNGTFSGQMCDQDQVCAINTNIPTRGNGYLSECVNKNDCVDTNGEVCGGNGYCQYDATTGGGKCVCPSPPDVTPDDFCETIMPFHLYEYDILTSKGGETRATWRMIPFKTCDSKRCNVQYFDDYACPFGNDKKYCTKDDEGNDDLFILAKYLEEELPDYEVINDYQIYQIIDNGLFDSKPRTGPNFPPRALTIAGKSNKSNSWTSIVNDTGNKFENGGFQSSSRVYNSFLIYKKKNQSISDGIYIFAFGDFMSSYSYEPGNTGFFPSSAYWLNISSNYSKTSDTPTTFYFKKAKKCCDADNIDCKTYNYCQINGIQNSQYGIDSNNNGGTCSDFDKNMSINAGDQGTDPCIPKEGKGTSDTYYRAKEPCSLQDGQTTTKNACVYRCTNQQSTYCDANDDTCICQRSELMTAKPFKWDFSNTDGSGVWKEVFLK